MYSIKRLLVYCLLFVVFAVATVVAAFQIYLLIHNSFFVVVYIRRTLFACR